METIDVFNNKYIIVLRKLLNYTKSTHLQNLSYSRCVDLIIMGNENLGTACYYLLNIIPKNAN